MIALLATSEMMESKPVEVEVKHNWGLLCVVSHDSAVPDGEGLHIAVEGSEESIRSWLYPFSPVWIGVGSPIFQEFERHDIKEG